MLKIRLRRIGKKRTPFYRVVVAEKEAKRDGSFLETLGSYDPHSDPPVALVDADKTREWIKKGAQPSDAAIKVLQRAGVLDTPAPVRKQEPAGKGKAGAKAASTPPAPAAISAASAASVVAVAEAPAAEPEAPLVADDVAPVAEAPAEEPEAGAMADDVTPAAENEVEAVAEAAIEGAESNEVAQEPGEDDVQAEAPTVE